MEIARMDLEISSSDVYLEDGFTPTALGNYVEGSKSGSYQDEVQPTTKIMHGDEGGFVTLSCNLLWFTIQPPMVSTVSQISSQFLLLTKVSSSPSVVNATPPYPRLSSKLNMEIAQVASERDRVSLSCNYTSSGVNLLWYRQHPKSAPQLVVMEYVDYTPGFSLNHDKKAKRMDLEISSAEVTDSALYYCALRPTVTGNPDTLYKNLEHLIEGRKLSTGTLINLSKTLRPRFDQNKHLLCQRFLVDLEIVSTEVTDSALYYCAMDPTVTGNTSSYKKLTV
ncbi:unnamed protein product [Coregonus sp. 'balchen']|nr:unnamed protein product [Coregonus sp. 'balchen']